MKVTEIAVDCGWGPVNVAIAELVDLEVRPGSPAVILPTLPSTGILSSSRSFSEASERPERYGFPALIPSTRGRLPG